MTRTGATAPVLFLHIGWARHYRGDADDPPQGKFGYIVKKKGDPAETRNFRPIRGRCHGYAPQATLNLGRLGASPAATQLDGVLVVWTATNPDGSGRYIVGWYRNARVFAGRREPRHLPFPVVTEAAAHDCHPLPLDERTFFVPSREKGWPGTSSAFYASAVLSTKEVGRILSYVGGVPANGFCAGRQPSARWGRSVATTEEKKEVEDKAVEAVEEHYRSLGWDVSNDCADNLGWDLTVTKGRRRLLVEVKGRRSSGLVTLTPNELRKARSPELRMLYRIAIVFQATSAKPDLNIFSYAPAKDAWINEGGAVLNFKEVPGAELSF